MKDLHTSAHREEVLCIIPDICLNIDLQTNLKHIENTLSLFRAQVVAHYYTVSVFSLLTLFNILKA